MSESTSSPVQQELPISVGDRLRQAREQAGLTTQEVADQTRIPRRHIEAIEGNRLSALPSGPYAVGFARAIARIVGFPEDEAASLMRSEMARGDHRHASPMADQFEPVDSARIPPGRYAWTAAIIGLLLIGAYTVWRTMGDAVPADESAANGGTSTSTAQETASAAASGDAAEPAAGLAGPLIVRASGDVWFGLNDPATGRLVFERTLRAGENYAVTEEQRGLLLRTGRPQNLRLVVGNREVPQLGAADLLVRDVALTPTALAERAQANAAAATSANAAR
jgi:cytoskeletal protein RodZ